jgi:hypothetical protein
MEKQQSFFKGRDNRNKNWFWLDNEYLNGYAKHFGAVGTAIYLSLCRHADSESQRCFPAQKQIAEELGINRDTVSKYLKIFEKYCLIEIIKERDKNQKWLNNVYTLLDKKYWLKPDPCGTGTHGEPCGNDRESHAELADTNNTQNTNNTHIAATAVLPPFKCKEYLDSILLKDALQQVRLIAAYALAKPLDFPSKKAVSDFISRNVRIAKQLVEYSESDFYKAMEEIKADKFYNNLNWGLETILKKIVK